MRGSRRCGAVPVRAVVWCPASRSRLSGGMLGLGSRARNWSWGWGAWLPRLLFSGKAPPHPPSLLIWGWVTLPAPLPAGEASPSAPCSALCCSRSRGRSGNPAGFSELPGRGASVRATPGRSSAGGLAFPSRPSCKPHLACPPVPALARWSRGVAPAVARARCGAGRRSWLQRSSFRVSVAVVGQSWSSELHTPGIFQAFLCQHSFSSFKYVVGRQVGQNFPLPSLLK